MEDKRIVELYFARNKKAQEEQPQNFASLSNLKIKTDVDGVYSAVYEN